MKKGVLLKNGASQKWNQKTGEKRGCEPKDRISFHTTNRRSLSKQKTVGKLSENQRTHYKKAPKPQNLKQVNPPRKTYLLFQLTIILDLIPHCVIIRYNFEPLKLSGAKPSKKVYSWSTRKYGKFTAQIVSYKNKHCIANAWNRLQQNPILFFYSYPQQTHDFTQHDHISLL